MSLDSWIKRHLFLILYIKLVLTVLLTIGVVAVFCVYVLVSADKLGVYHPKYVVEYSLVLAAFFFTSYGILIYRVFPVNAVVIIIHILLHLCGVICMALNVFVYSGDEARDYSRIFKIPSYIVLIMYILQIILGICTVLLWRGKTVREQEKRSGMHAFIGLVTFAALLWNTFIRLSMMCAAPKHKRRSGESIYLNDITPEPLIMVGLILLYTLIMFVILLTPYFEAEHREIMAIEAKE